MVLAYKAYNYNYAPALENKSIPSYFYGLVHTNTENTLVMQSCRTVQVE